MRFARHRSKIVALVLAAVVSLGLGGCVDTTATPPSYLVAIINSSAPRGDVSGAQFCAGVLVSPTLVLTAKHCVNHKSASSMDVIVGANNLCNTAPIAGTRLAVVAIRVNSDLDSAQLRIAAGAKQKPVRVGPGSAIPAVAWGWGKDSIGGVAPCAASAKSLSPVGITKCARALAAVPTLERAAYLCAVPAAQKNTCEGDSGGPVVSDAGTLVAITIGGIGCGPQDPGTYLRARAAMAQS